MNNAIIEKINKRISNLEQKFKKVEDSSKKSELDKFSERKLIKWAVRNEIDLSSIKKQLIEIIWDNMNNWEWEYYSESGSEPGSDTGSDPDSDSDSEYETEPEPESEPESDLESEN